MKLPHSLRVVIFLLRLALGLNFFYLGFSVLFQPTLGTDMQARSFSNIYSWLATPAVQGGWIQPVAQWAFLIIGACLIIGLFTRLASIAGIAVVLLSYLPTITYAAPNIMQFINDEVIVVICLLVLVFAKAGSYIGADMFIHFRNPKKG